MTEYSENGGVQLPYGTGMLAVTWPFGHITIKQDVVVLSIDTQIFFHKEVSIPFDKISYIEQKRYVPFFADGIKIVMHDMTPEWAYFWSLRSSSNISRELQSRGAPIR